VRASVQGSMGNAVCGYQVSCCSHSADGGHEINSAKSSSATDNPLDSAEDKFEISRNGTNADPISSAPEEVKPLPLTENYVPARDSSEKKEDDVCWKSEANRLSMALEEQAEKSQALEAQQADEMRQERKEEWEAALKTSRANMKRHELPGGRRPANRYGSHFTFPVFDKNQHVPLLALVNPMSGAMAGTDILACAHSSEYYQDRFFNIIDVVKGQRRGGLMDVFRIELLAAKEEAAQMNTRPRLISGGGDGTGSFAIFIVFLALRADASREEDGLCDSGNGFIWTDEEMEKSFPAIAQMPLGSANDFGNILGWGQKYPGDPACCGGREGSKGQLTRWIQAVISPSSPVVNFDMWGILPAPGTEKCDFKLAELTGKRGSSPKEVVEGKKQLVLKEAGKPVPFFICLYFTCGFGAYMVGRFQINRRKTPLRNRLEYTRQAVGIVTEPTPPQLNLRCNGVKIDCEGKAYFPPRRHLGVKGRAYREVGFYNINWQAHALHGADRASLGARLCSSRKPVMFNDGLLDMMRWRFTSIIKNPGLRLQTDKKKDMLLNFAGGEGKGLFFQWDGEARFAFSPSGKDFNIFIRKVLTIPVVIGPYHNPKLTGPIDNGKPVKFEMFGETPAERELVRKRILANVGGKLDSEMNATAAEIQGAKLKMKE